MTKTANKHDGDAAFPGIVGTAGNGGYTQVPSEEGWAWQKHNPGMCLRDYFAARVMTGLCSSENALANFTVKMSGIGARNIQERVRVAYQIADAMIEESCNNLG